MDMISFPPSSDEGCLFFHLLWPAKHIWKAFHTIERVFSKRTMYNLLFETRESAGHARTL